MIFTESLSVLHITTPEPLSLKALRPTPWGVVTLIVTQDFIYWKANIEGWSNLFVMPLSGEHKDKVIEIRPAWEGGGIYFKTNQENGKPHELIIKLKNYCTPGTIAHLDISVALQKVQTDASGNAFISVPLKRYSQASLPDPAFPTVAPKLIRFKSFDGLEISGIYYHPNEGHAAVPVVLSIHGGPESQSSAITKVPIHGYLMNQLGIAVIYPNVRGSAGYGKKFMDLDSVEKREDSVKDIGALIDYIEKNMPNELDSSRIAVMGGSYGGYMVFASLTHFSPNLACGVANFGIAHFPSFLRNTAPWRRNLRRKKYGDESDPETCAMLERISPLNNAAKITKPLSIAHGENDSRVTIEEAMRMYDIVKKNGVRAELIVCEKEGHGWKQKSVIEYTNAAKIHFLQRFLLAPKTSSL
ncbi:Alpha/Beta hydrolase protein [Mycena floridula]|nr:Alpha/Beta hydrolase protein [Mycena floridula]